MRAVFRLENGLLTLTAPGLQDDRSRPVGNTDRQRFTDWQADYRRLREHEGAEARLLALGRELYEWLDRGERWLGRDPPGGGAASRRGAPGAGRVRPDRA
jgi:hypothetical protein